MRGKRKSTVKKHYFLIGLVLCIIAASILLMPFTVFKVSASEKNHLNLEYKTYVVHTGDTLWGIADMHMSDDFGGHQAYIDEVMRANGLTNSYIYDGQLLIIPIEADMTTQQIATN